MLGQKSIKQSLILGGTLHKFFFFFHHFFTENIRIIYITDEGIEYDNEVGSKRDESLFNIHGRINEKQTAVAPYINVSIEEMEASI